MKSGRRENGPSASGPVQDEKFARLWETDKPAARSLLAESYKEWVNEAAELPLFQHVTIMLLDPSGELSGWNGSSSAADIATRSIRTMRGQFNHDEPGQIHLINAHGLDAAVIEIKLPASEPASIYWIAATESGGLPDGQVVQLGAKWWRSCFYRLLDRLHIRELEAELQQTVQKASANETLHLAAKRLYDQFEVSAVLTELLASLAAFYPRAEVLLFLSQDYRHEDPRVKPLMFKNTTHDLVAKAFLEGRRVMERRPDGSVDIALPMSGKQANYGVLCAAFAPDEWDEAHMASFMLLADSGGTAFENARLYEQSNVMIDELRLINELAKQLNQSLKLSKIFNYVTTELLRIFNADYCCVLQLDKRQGRFTVMSSNIPAMSEFNFLPDYGFSGIVCRTKEPIIISDYWQTRVVDSALMDQTGARSLIASPILIENEVAGVVMTMHNDPNYFSYDNYKLLQVISTHIGLAVTNASLHAEVRRMVITDTLTGLHARHYLNEQIQSRQRKDTLGSLILVDIDYFKQVNDTFGHQVGDRILVQVSEIIKASIRQGDIAARWAGKSWPSTCRASRRIRLTALRNGFGPVFKKRRCRKYRYLAAYRSGRSNMRRLASNLCFTGRTWPYMKPNIKGKTKSAFVRDDQASRSLRCPLRPQTLLLQRFFIRY
ncbi:sensor domain-containing diguanylate cyclase [Paenibacillus protaetiae]|uniref:sensor domain-containing diguanylate cyclase n=1 Tax=Paenibacillus protaetiae TaxID=2509456 RepID=UPI001FCA0ACD|nr:diguanylate cyclase [Paenibacillus protaetiae]